MKHMNIKALNFCRYEYELIKKIVETAIKIWLACSNHCQRTPYLVVYINR